MLSWLMIGIACQESGVSHLTFCSYCCPLAPVHTLATCVSSRPTVVLAWTDSKLCLSCNWLILSLLQHNTVLKSGRLECNACAAYGTALHNCLQAGMA